MREIQHTGTGLQANDPLCPTTHATAVQCPTIQNNALSDEEFVSDLGTGFLVCNYISVDQCVYDVSRPPRLQVFAHAGFFLIDFLEQRGLD